MTSRMGDGAPSRRGRDPRLDFFRGYALIAILVTHAPGNPLASWMPSAFGFSDAADIFVFCSGLASAAAYGATFARQGWWIGTVQVMRRIWQLYRTHIAVFLTIFALVAALMSWPDAPRNYLTDLNLQHFARDPLPNSLGLLTLTYVPNYFDILPMYMALLALVPLAVLLAGVRPALALGASLALWFAARSGLNLPAEPWSDRGWYFNPFAWQVLFFLGYGFRAGWLATPPIRRPLVALAIAFVALSMPLAHPRPFGLEEIEALAPWTSKTLLGPLRLAHFCALAYLALAACGPRGAGLAGGSPARRRIVAELSRIGRNSLPVFVAGLVLSRLMGVSFDLLGRSFATAVLVNAAGIALLVALAHLLAWMKTEPWTAGEEPRVAV
jgi:hypothetical protein